MSTPPGTLLCDVDRESVGGGVSDDVDAIVSWKGRIYIGGEFEYAGYGPNTVNSVAVWDESSGTWLPLNKGVVYDDGGEGYVGTLRVWNDVLLAAGEFDNAGGKYVPVRAIPSQSVQGQAEARRRYYS